MDTQKNIDEYIGSFNDWRSERLRELQTLINTTDPSLTQDFKWGVPVWTSNGLVCAISGFKDHVKINFFKGAHLPVPKKQFNSGLDSKDHRSINIAENDAFDHEAAAGIIRAAVGLNKK